MILPREVFISHAHQDRDLAARLVEVLAGCGIASFYSPACIKGAQQWHDEIGEALRRCDWFAIILTPAAVRSKWVKRELLYALDHDQYERRIIPILRKLCDHEALSWTLSNFQFVDFRGSHRSSCKTLLEIWDRPSAPD